MKLTREQLLQIAKEELQKVVAEVSIKFRKTGKATFFGGQLVRVTF